MRDEDKTKEQLINELTEMRRQIAELEALETERRWAEEALKQSEARYRSLFEDSPISLWEEDFSAIKTYLDSLRASGVKDFRAHFEHHPEAVVHCAAMVKVVDVNQTTLEMYKASSKEELQNGATAVFSEESYKPFREELIYIAEGKTRLEIETIHQTLRGDKKHVALRWCVAPGYEQTLSKVLVSIIDITERKQAEEDIRRLSQFRESIIDNANVWLDVLDDKANVLVWNKAAEEISGYSRHEVVGHDKVWEWLYPDEEYRTEIMAGAANTIGRKEFETTIRCKDGHTRIISWNSRKLADEKGELIGRIVIGRDVTEFRPAEEERGKTAEVEMGDLISMCASCKRIRDEEDCWHPIETYMTEYCDIRISHGICPECARKLYPELFKDEE